MARHLKVRSPRPMFALALIAAALGGCAVREYPVDAHREAEIRAIEELPPDDARRERQRLAELHPEWPEAARAAVGAGEVDIGMSREQLLYAWGYPTSRWPYPPEDGDLEEWQYGQVRPIICVDVDGQGVVRVRYGDAEYPDFAHKPPRGMYGYRRVGDPG